MKVREAGSLFIIIAIIAMAFLSGKPDNGVVLGPDEHAAVETQVEAPVQVSEAEVPIDMSEML